MRLHIAQIGTGRVGRPTAYTILCAGLTDELTLCDIKPGLARGFAEELMHVAASLRMDVDINHCERDEEVSGADIIIVSAGMPRPQGVKTSRRDLVTRNSEIVRHIAESTAGQNRGAKYIVVTNPVDVMAMVCKRYSRADFTISTGTNLESLRLRSKLARDLKVPVSKVLGWAAGEHGEAAVILWSTAKAYGIPVEEYAKSKGVDFNKQVVESYMKEISEFVINSVGGTEYGPAASFRDIVRSIVNNTDEILAVGIPLSFDCLPEPVHVSVPVRMGWNLGPTLLDFLDEGEKSGVEKAASAIYRTYMSALDVLE